MHLIKSTLAVYLGAFTVVSAQGSIAEVAQDNGFTTLLTAATATGQADVLANGDGPLTVFAPSNDAFDALPAGVLAFLLEPANVAALSSILEYHIVPGTVLATDLVDGMTPASLTGQTLDISITDAGAKVNGASIGPADLRADNGVVHAIDAVLLPPDLELPPNLVEAAVASPELFSTLVAAITAADLGGTLTSGVFTVFAPTNEAFAALPTGALEFLLRNPDTLAKVLLYHVADGETMSGALSDGMDVPTLDEGNSLSVGIADGTVTIGGATVVTPDVTALNGVIHVIDSVLIPSDITLPPSIPTIAMGDTTTTLKAALDATGLTAALSEAGPFTVFAPTDAAFEMLPEGLVEALLAEEDMVTLKKILMFHVVSPDLITAADIVGGLAYAETLQGQNVTFMAPMDGMGAMINGAGIVAADVTALNGIVHVIDAVILPEGIVLPEIAGACQGIAEVALATGQFGSLLAAIEAAGLGETLSLPGPFTVFAPTDAAFDKVENWTDILDDPLMVVGILTYHVVGGKVLSTDLADGMSIVTLAQKTLTVKIEGDMIMINDAHVVQADLVGCNGVVHGIDAVLFAPVDVATDAPDVATDAPVAAPTNDEDGALIMSNILSLLSTFAMAAGIAIV